MGIIKGIGSRFFERKPGLLQEREDAVKEFSVLSQEPAIYGNPLAVAVLSGIKGGEIWNFGKKGYPEGHNPYQEFAITDTSEIIIACMIGTDSVLEDDYVKLVMTDKALYRSEKVVQQYCYSDGIRRIGYEDLGMYIISGDKEDVRLETFDDTIPLLATTVLKANKENRCAAKELRNLLFAVQKKAIECTDKAKTERMAFYNKIEQQLANNAVFDNMKKARMTYVLGELWDDPVIGMNCRVALLRTFVCSCDYYDFGRILETINIKSENDESWYINRFEHTVKSYMAALSDKDTDFSDALSSTYIFSNDLLINPDTVQCSNRTQKMIVEIIEDNQKYILAYLSIRRNPYRPAENLRQYLISVGITGDDVFPFLKFHACIQNRGMLEVYRCIKRDGKFKKEWIGGIDSFGLTPLHYSLILGNSRMTEYLYRNKLKLAETQQDLGIGLGRYHSYLMVACFLGRKGLLNTILNDEEEVKYLRKEKRKMQVKRHASKVGEVIIGSMGKVGEQQQLSGYGDTQEIAGMVGEARKNYDFSLKGLQNEIDATRLRLAEPYFEMADVIRSPQEILDLLFHKLYLETDKLEEALQAETKKCYYFSDNETYALLVSTEIISKEEADKFKHRKN